MRTNRTLFLYITREILFYTTLSFALMISLLVADQVIQRLDDLVAVGVTPADFATVVLGIVVMIATYAVPIAFIYGTVLAVMRLAGDGEILALRSSGFGPWTVLAPALVLALAISALTTWIVFNLEFKARQQIREVFLDVATRGGIIRPGEFRGFGGLVVHVDGRTRENELTGVMIYKGSDDQRNYVVFATDGRLERGATKESLVLALGEGEIHFATLDGQVDRYQMMLFETLEYDLRAGELIHPTRWFRRPDELSVSELRQRADDVAAGRRVRGILSDYPLAYDMELQRRLSLPFAPLLFALVAVPLGMQSRSASRALGTLACAVAVFGYYMLFVFGRNLVEDGMVAPAVAGWAPNALLALAAAVLLLRMRKGFSG